MLNEIVVVTVSAFNKPGSEADKNGVQNVWLTVIAGKMPNRAMVVAGTVAAKAGLEVGKTLLVMINERTPDETYGRQFGHTVLGEVKPTEILGMRKELGAAVVLDVTTSVTPEATAEGATPSLATSGLGNAEGGKSSEVKSSEVKSGGQPVKADKVSP